MLVGIIMRCLQDVGDAGVGLSLTRPRIVTVVLSTSWRNEASDRNIDRIVEFDLVEVPIIGITTNLLPIAWCVQRL